MAYAEIINAIAWSKKTTDTEKFAVTAYFTKHFGYGEPFKAEKDAVVYASGEVVALESPTPHLKGTLAVSRNGDQAGQMSPSLKSTVDVEIFPDGKLRYLMKLDGEPIGKMPPTEVNATSINDVLVTAVTGSEVVTLGVARMPSVKVDPCQPVWKQVVALETKIEQIQSSPDYIQGPDGPHPGKPDPELLAEVKSLQAQKTQKYAQYKQCKLAHGGLDNLDVTFQGTAVLTTTKDEAKGPFSRNVAIGLRFNQWEHATVDVTSFPAIVVGPFDVPGPGDNTTTITQAGTETGVFNRSTGVLELTIPLHFDHSHPFAGDSDITFKLSTEKAPGSRMAANGDIVIVGTGVFKGGFLGGETGTLRITGRISPHP